MEKQQAPSKFNMVMFLRTMIIGIFGGLFAGIFLLIQHYFNMTEVNPKTILYWIFQDGKWMEKWYAYIIVLLLFSLLSAIIAHIYYFLFKKQESWVVGALYGIAVWATLYVLVPVLINGYNPFDNLESESHVSMFCLLVLHGVFTGYSISFEYANIKEEYK